MNLDFWIHFFLGIVWTINLTLMALLIAQSLSHLAWLILAFFELRKSLHHEKKSDMWWMLTRDVTFSISLLVPAHNEENTIVENVRSLLALHYPDFEVIVVNDGSKDGTLRAIIDNFGLQPVERAYEQAVPHRRIQGIYGNPRYPRLLVVDKENGGKSDALNAAINLSRCPIICSIDADSILDNDALLRSVRPFIEEPERMVAVGGTIRIANGCTVAAGQVVRVGLPRQILPLLQTIEYIRAFLIARLAWSRSRAMIIISGAFGLFRRNAVIEAGGYTHGTVGEDMELVVKLHRYFRESKLPYSMRYVPDPVCWTEAPDTVQILRRQRTRWQRGLMDTLWRHRKLLFNPRYGTVGLLALPYFFIFDVVGAIMETVGYVLVPLCWWSGVLSFEFLIAFIMLTFVTGIGISVGSLILAELSLRQSLSAGDLLVLTGCAIAENFGYRQLNSLWRIQGIWEFFTGKQGWGVMTRTGFKKKTV